MDIYSRTQPYLLGQDDIVASTQVNRRIRQGDGRTPPLFRRRRLASRRRNGAVPYLLLAPAAITVSVVLLYPLVFNLVASFFNWRLTSIGEASWVGWGNFSYLFGGNADFWKSLWFTVSFTVVTTVLALVSGTASALLVAKIRRGRTVLMSLLLLPFVVAPLAAGLLWRLLLLPDVSPVNWALRSVGLPEVHWLTDPAAAFWAVSLAEIWRSIPFVILLLVAALTAIPDDLYSAAKIDGANAWHRFWRITLPLLRPALTIVLVFEAVIKLRLYDLVVIMTSGGPANSTLPLGLLLQREYFLNQDAGSAAALGTILFFLGAAVSLLLVKVVYRRVTY